MIFRLFLVDPVAGLIVFGAIIVAIGIHEAAHAYAADYLGDDTPRRQGRLTLNPLNHLDPWGTALIFFVGIGWGKAVQFNPFNLKDPKRDIALVALAGPMSNIVMAILAGILMGMVDFGTEAYMVLEIFMQLNLILAIFNLIPVDPLDGFKVVAGILPAQLTYQWEETRRYGFFILLFLLFTGIASDIVFPTAMQLQQLILSFTLI